MMSRMNKDRIAKELNDGCEHNDREFFDQYEWRGTDIPDEEYLIRQFCSKKYFKGKSEDKNDYKYVLCDSCEKILDKYKNLDSMSTNDILGNILNRLDELERSVRELKNMQERKR